RTTSLVTAGGSTDARSRSDGKPTHVHYHIKLSEYRENLPSFTSGDPGEAMLGSGTNTEDLGPHRSILLLAIARKYCVLVLLNPFLSAGNPAPTRTAPWVSFTVPGMGSTDPRPISWPCRTRLAAALATSMALATAMPTSACFRAGASFTPAGPDDLAAQQ